MLVCTVFLISLGLHGAFNVRIFAANQACANKRTNLVLISEHFKGILVQICPDYLSLLKLTLKEIIKCECEFLMRAENHSGV